MTTTTSRYGSAVVTTPDDLSIRIERQFDAPAALVWKAWTTPSLVQRWWSEADLDVCEIDLRVGGAWRYVFTHEAGFEVGFHGVYSTVEAPTALEHSEVFEGMPDFPAITSLTFTEVDGVTTLVSTTTHQEKAHRDAHLDSGMEGGMQLCMNRIDDLCAELAT